jgi:hypothetical protein
MSETFTVVPLYFEQSVYILDTENSTSKDTGSLIVYGGVGVDKDLHVDDNVYIGGNLFVDGETTYVNTTTLDIADNSLLINAGPMGSRDAGVFIARHPSDVTSETSVTNGTTNLLYNTSGILDVPSLSAGDFNGWWAKVSSGNFVYYAQVESSSLGESSDTTTIVFSTKGNTIPTTGNFTGTIDLYKKSYFGLYLDEDTDKFVFGYVSDPSDPKEDFDSTGMLGDIILKSIESDTINIGSGISTGSLYVSGGSILAEVTTGALFVSGASLDVVATNISFTTPTNGSILFNGIDISPSENDITRERMFMIPIDNETNKPVTDFTFSNLTTRSFEASVSVTLEYNNGTKYSLYSLKGLQRGTMGNWYFNSNFIGDNLDMDFSISSENDTAQILYTIGDYPQLVSTGSIMKFRALTTSV